MRGNSELTKKGFPDGELFLFQASADTVLNNRLDTGYSDDPTSASKDSKAFFIAAFSALLWAMKNAICLNHSSGDISSSFTEGIRRSTLRRRSLHPNGGPVSSERLSPVLRDSRLTIITCFLTIASPWQYRLTQNAAGCGHLRVLLLGSDTNTWFRIK